MRRGPATAESDPSPPVRLGAWAPLLAATAWGASVPFSKLWLEGASRTFAAGWIYVSSGVGLFVLRRLSRRRGVPLARADLPYLALAVAFGSVLAPIALFTGLERAPANLSSLLLNLEVVFTAVLAVAFFGERLIRRHVLGIVLVVLAGAGTFLVERATPEEGGGGGLWIVAACFFWALDNNVTRRIAAKDAVEIAAWKGLVGGTLVLAGGLAFGHPLPTGSLPWVGGAVIGLTAYGLGLSLFVVGLRTVGAARTMALFGVHPLVGVVASALVLGEPLTWLVAGLAVVVAAGVALLVLDPRRASDAPGAAPPDVA